MRIQQTDAILKEARAARHNAAAHSDNRNFFARLWTRVTALFQR